MDLGLKKMYDEKDKTSFNYLLQRKIFPIMLKDGSKIQLINNQEHILIGISFDKYQTILYHHAEQAKTLLKTRLFYLSKNYVNHCFVFLFG